VDCRRATSIGLLLLLGVLLGQLLLVQILGWVQGTQRGDVAITASGELRDGKSFTFSDTWMVQTEIITNKP